MKCIFCDPDRTQTCDLQNRNLSFYSLNYGACFFTAQNYINFCSLQTFFH